MQQRVLITDFICDDLATEKQILGDIAAVESLNASDEQQLLAAVENVDAIMMYHTVSISRLSIERMQRCKLIVRCGAGFDNVDTMAARAKGIPVANVPDYGTEEVADSAIALTLSLARGVSYLNSRLRANLGPWSYQQVVPTWRLRNRVFGIVGLGRIGSAAAIRAKSLGMQVVFYDPYKPDGYDKALGVKRADSLEALLEQCHIVSLHCPLTIETRHLIDSQALSHLPAGGFLVNTSRGGVVDPQAVVEAIESGRLVGAGIDVLENEPADESNPLVKAWRDPRHPAHHRVILNPHSAFYCEEGLIDMRVSGAKACRAALLGEPIRNVVN